MENLRFTLIQCRNPDDPMRKQEIQCFYQVLNFPGSIVTAVNILEELPHTKLFEQTDAIIVGGSGDYSVIAGHSFLKPLFEFLGDVCEAGFPMFALRHRAACRLLGT